MKRYEIVLIVLSDLSKDDVDGLIERYSTLITDQKGLVVKVEKWGTRRLAYRIKKQPRGSYILIDFVCDSAAVNELERNLKFDDNVLRFQTIKKEDRVHLPDIEAEIAGAQEKPPEESGAAAPAEAIKEIVVQESSGSEKPAPAATEEKGEEG